jgi:hypothetical protein
MHTHAHDLIEHAADESRRNAYLHDRPAVSESPTVRELLQRVVPGIFFVPLAGPPVILLLGPWLLLVLLIIPPAAFVITLVLVFLVAGGLLAAFGALIASPYLLVRHLRGRPAVHLPRFAFVRSAAGAARGWFREPAAGIHSARASFASQPDSRDIQITPGG